jgi:hypothetical protein
MATKAELIEVFRKATEDLMQAKDRITYKAKYGENVLAVGDNTITLPIADDTAYATADEYDISFIEALDADDIDIRPALVISNKTATSFKVYSPNITTLRWQTYLKVPNFNFFT